MAKTKLEAHQMEIAPSEAEADRKQKERIAKAEQAIKEYNDGLAERLADWEGSAAKTTKWTGVELGELKATNGTTLEKRDGNEILASGALKKNDYTVKDNPKLR